MSLKPIFCGKISCSLDFLPSISYNSASIMENVIYQVYNSQQAVEPVVRRVSINFLDGLVLEKTIPNTVKKPFVIKLAKILAVIGTLILLIYFLPALISKLDLSKGEVDKLAQESQNTSQRTLPAFNPALPKTNHLKITSIGVDTVIAEATYEDYESALKEGVWRVSDFGQPNIDGAPMILAAHRFGYLAWTNTFRHKSSFYNLPKVEVGDTITIDWQQRQYSYGVYKTENGEEITDYGADLILYTCESLNGPERIFVYANLI